MSWLCTQIELRNFANFPPNIILIRTKWSTKKNWRLLAGHKMDVLKILAWRWIEPDKAKVTMEYKKCRKLVAPFLIHLSVTLNPYLWTPICTQTDRLVWTKKNWYIKKNKNKIPNANQIWPSFGTFSCSHLYSWDHSCLIGFTQNSSQSSNDIPPNDKKNITVTTKNVNSDEFILDGEMNYELMCYNMMNYIFGIFSYE